MKGLTYKILLVVASTFATAVLVEAALRISGYRPPKTFVSYSGREKIKKPFPGVRYVYPADLLFSQYWPDNPRSYFDAKGNSLDYRTNNFGFRGENFQIERNDSLRIAFLGDSFCWGTGVRLEDTLTVRIEQDLNQRKGLGRSIEVYNFGLPGFNTNNEAALYDHVVRHFQPDLLVVLYFLNDVNLPPERSFAEGPEWAPGLRRFSLLADLVITGFNRQANHTNLVSRVADAYENGHPGITSVENALARIGHINALHEVPTVLVAFPWLIELDDNYPLSFCHERIGSIAEKEGFTYLDLLPVFRSRREKDLWVHTSDQHPNELAHQIAANAISDVLATFIRDNSDALFDNHDLRRTRQPTVRDPESGKPRFSVFSPQTSEKN